jgi:hypothetical protein
MSVEPVPEDPSLPGRLLNGPLVLRPFARFLSTANQEIDCPHMQLETFSGIRPPVFEGSGRLILEGTQNFRFQIQGQPRDLKLALDSMRANSEYPENRQNWLRLTCTDYTGIHWNAGWVGPRVNRSNELGWLVSGEFSGLTTDVRQEAPISGVELGYFPAPDVPFSEQISTTTQLGEHKMEWRAAGGRHRLAVLGSEIEVGTQPWADGLWMAATSSDALQHPYLENWLSEPLRALRGKLIYPRLVARRFDDGRAFVSIRAAPALEQTFGGCAAVLRNRRPAEFWEFYTRYLTYVAEHRDKTGSPNFEANTLTRLHDEVIQARRAGSSWVIALTVASAVEGVLKAFPDFEEVVPEFTPADLAPIAALIPNLEDTRVRKALQGFVDRKPQPSAGGYLRRLQQTGQISKDSVDAWRYVRNKVVHGNLFDPWGDEDQVERVKELLKLFYDVTAIAIGYSQVPSTTGAS